MIQPNQSKRIWNKFWNNFGAIQPNVFTQDLLNVVFPTILLLYKIKLMISHFIPFDDQRFLLITYCQEIHSKLKFTKAVIRQLQIILTDNYQVNNSKQLPQIIIK